MHQQGLWSLLAVLFNRERGLHALLLNSNLSPAQ
jgi:hypothetical protein